MKSVPEETETVQSSLQAYITLLRASDTVSAKVGRSLLEHKLTLSQFGVMEALYHLGPLCQKQIGQKILKSASNLTTVIRNLQRDGFIKSTRENKDKRYLTICLTPKGKKLMEEILPGHFTEIDKCMSALNCDERKHLNSLCKKLGLSNL
ncbi:MAG TPA: MarR family transcriptional regulator [Leptospiraceae bacterium]|nr:MarR family transcriptional regulator [Leptospiraceae bacterium]HMY65315.1 MarR family transcriptional regulator [Leptospiraceae bacterium]HNF12034.1 MarR family transcriptional regulator [Leptospiraceae bacterium]HNF23944.1 MarR family transcriptional regulator [Leptospiraceae bacterium]HNI27472.1 MarR family transcriptional regulator [Leptospiraceae bacterium]